MSRNFFNRSPDYDHSGPRPPVPGQEETRHKMTDNVQNEQQMALSSSSSSLSPSPPSCLRWAENLSNLLEDAEGNQLFKSFVEQEGGIHAERLNFYFVVEGLRQHSVEINRPQSTEDKRFREEQVRKIIRAIFKFLMKSQIQMPENVRRYWDISRRDENYRVPVNIFDQLQQDIARIINETTYRTFLQSEMYIEYIQQNSASAIDRGHEASITISNTTTSTTSITVSGSSSMFLSGSSTLPTLHEEGDGPAADSYDFGAVGGFRGSSNRVPISSSSSSSKIPMSLTKDALIATQRERLAERPPAAHGYNYSYNNAVSYNPVSRRDSEQASMSSGRTDSDISSLDGRQVHRQRRSHQQPQGAGERRQQIDNMAYVNKNSDGMGGMVIPRTAVVPAPNKPISFAQLHEALCAKLMLVKQDQDIKEIMGKKLFANPQTEPSFDETLCAKLKMYDNRNDQDILDQHVTRVFDSPLRSPGNTSPSTNQFVRRNPHHLESIAPSARGAQSSMRSTRPPPDSNLRKTKNWGSIYTDSGISMFGSETSTMRNMASSSCGSSTSRQRTQMPPPEALPAPSTMKGQLEDIRRTKRHHQQPSASQKNDIPPPLPVKNFSQPASSSASIVSNTSDEAITVVCSFSDEDVPYRFRIHDKLPTLKLFKELLPKKGNYRFFFKKRCDDPDVPICNEEIHNDADPLPLFDGKVMAQARLGN